MLVARGETMATAAREQKELLALMHQQLVQMGYERAAKELLEQSGQVTAPLAHVAGNMGTGSIAALWKGSLPWKSTAGQVAS